MESVNCLAFRLKSYLLLNINYSPMHKIFLMKICVRDSFTVTQGDVLGCNSNKTTSFQQMF